MSLPEWKHPVVGAFILPGIVARLRNRKLNFRSYWRVLELAKTAQELGITLYYFSNRHVDFQQKQVRGVWLDEKTETWKTGTFPLPDVLYDRQGAEGAGSPEKMRELGIPCINPTWVLNKWKTYKALSGSPEIRPHLPPTYSYSRSRLVSALERCGTVYVKACVGSRGAQVLRITRIGKQHYECRYWKEKLVATRIQGTRNLAVFTKHFFKGRKILIQPSISLLTKGDRPVDFRAELQRNGEGKLEIAGIAARIGMKHSPVTAHAEAESMERFLRKHGPFSRDEQKVLIRKTHSLLKNVYTELEKHYGPFGEMGIDIAIDPKGETVVD